jgi:type II secretory ATPase GspE/PulE/Tfp pilus assembly ATPase PilB-like protein
LLEESGLDPAVYGDHTFYEGAGCIECNGTGFHGRLAISELLDLSDHIRELILAAAGLRDQARRQGRGGDDLPPRVGRRAGGPGNHHAS